MRLVGGTGYSGGQEKDGMVRLKEDNRDVASSSKGGERLDERSADGFDGSRRGQRHS